MHGFSIVELSIVLLIVAGILAGIMTATDMQARSKLISSVAQLEGYKASVIEFREKYHLLPGDMPNAFTYFNAPGGCTDVDVNGDSAGCNGDGDGLVELHEESWRAWQHLAAAEFIEGDYTGVDAGDPDYQANVNVPSLSQQRVLIRIDNATVTYEEAPNPVFTGLRIMLGALSSNPADWDDIYNAGALSPEDAQLLDRKIDDGIPSDGLIIAEDDGASDPLDSFCMNNHEYNIEEQKGQYVCVLSYFIDIYNES